MIKVHTLIQAVVMGSLTRKRLVSMIKYCLIFLLIAGNLSCLTNKRAAISKSTIKLEGKNTNIRSLMEIDGYYCNPNYSGTNFASLMFFEDGTCVNLFLINNFQNNELKAELLNSGVFKIINNQIISFSDWGTYKIEGDTLISYYYIQGSFWTPWYITEYRYKIRDRQTIQPIYSKGLLPPEDKYSKDPWLVNRSNSYFTPADSMPPSDNWLKEKKWIWRHERDWKAYMEKIKQEKKKRK